MQDLTPEQLLDKWTAHHEAAATDAETLAQQVRREFAALGWTVDGLPDDASPELVREILEGLLSQLQERAA
jgi:hypothetical protein